MKSIQYTIRSVPLSVDRYLRKRSKLSGKSLNQVIIEELSAKVAPQSEVIGNSLDWFIGRGGLDAASLQALADDECQQKALAAKELDL